MARRKIGAASDWVLPIGVLAIGGYLVYKFVGSGATGTAQNNANINANTAATAASDLSASQAAGVAQTVSDSTLNGYADTLYQLLGNGGDPAQIDQVVTMVNNATDWYRLVQLFGTKQFNSGGSFSTCALLGLGCDSWDLLSALRNVLPAQNLANINTYFSDQGINVVL